MRCMLVSLSCLLMIGGCLAAINPTPETYTLPYPGIRSISLARNTTTVVAATYSQAYAIYTKYNGGPMTLISKTDYWGGDFRCLLLSEGMFQVGVITSMPSNFSTPINYLSYSFQEPAGTFVLQSELTYDIDSYDITCETEASERKEGSGFYFGTRSSLYFMKRLESTPSSLVRAGPLIGVTDVYDIITIPGTNTSQYLPTTMVITSSQPEATAAIAQYSLPTPATSTRTRVLADDEIGAQYINLGLGYGPDLPSQGLLLTTLKNKAGIRLTPFDFGSFTPSSAAVVDTQTVRGDYPQRILTQRNNYCVYVVGAHPSSTSAQPVVTLTQWWSNKSSVAPTKIDQVTLKLKSSSMNGIVSMRAGWMGFVYLADDQTIYRFQTQCPDSL